MLEQKHHVNMESILKRKECHRKIVCYACRWPGHMMTSCPKLKKESLKITWNYSNASSNFESDAKKVKHIFYYKCRKWGTL